jgi:hypothetical protein
MGTDAGSSCNVASEGIPGGSSLTANLNGQSFAAMDGYTTVQTNAQGQITLVGLAFSSVANACGYAESGALKEGSLMATFTIQPPAGTTSLSQLAGNTYPVFSTTLITEMNCSRVSYLSTQCDAGLSITFGAATSGMQTGGQLIGTCNGTCTSGPCKDAVSGSPFSLPVCPVTASPTACCP